MSCSECSRDDAIICSMLCRSMRGARARPARIGSSIARPRAARASELTDSVTVFVPSSMVPSTMAPSSVPAPSAARGGLMEVKSGTARRISQAARVPRILSGLRAHWTALSRCNAASAKRQRLRNCQVSATTFRHVVIAAPPSCDGHQFESPPPHQPVTGKNAVRSLQRNLPEASRPRPWRASPPSKSVDARDKLIASLNGSKAYGQHVLAKPVP